MWALRGLRNGVVTTRWPTRPDEYAAGTRGPAEVCAGPAEAGAGPDPERLCPANAIIAAGRELRVDQGRCIQCGRCVAARPDVFAWSQGPDQAAVTRAGLVVPAAETP